MVSGQPGHFPDPTGEPDMPEPGINDPGFNRPTAKPVRGPQHGRLAMKRLRAPIKVPGEYAEVRLKDGKFQGEASLLVPRFHYLDKLSIISSRNLDADFLSIFRASVLQCSFAQSHSCIHRNSASS